MLKLKTITVNPRVHYLLIMAHPVYYLKRSVKKVYSVLFIDYHMTLTFSQIY